MAVTVRDGVELHYEVTGDGAPTLLISGFAADATFWAGMVPQLAERHRVVTFDPRGSGRSSAPDHPYDLDKLGEDALAVLAAAGITRAHIVGHSLGAGVAQWLACHRPELVSTLVLASAATRLRAHGRLALTAAGHFYDTDPAPIQRLAESLYPWMFSQAFLEDADNLGLLLRASLQHPFPQSRAGYLGQLAALLSMDTTPWLPRITAPTLVLIAQHDLLLPMEDTVSLALTIPGAQAVSIPGAGHCTPIERPELCSALTLGHLAAASEPRSQV
ncbi:MAG: alpha/beta hydrolase fold protein [Pseudonocardia sp.]|nr:alpha/beta hydrolase fold protein [Pseudonocardia sp.]